MKRLFLTLSLIAASSLLFKCGQVEYVETPRVEPVFSEQAQEWGELFAETLTATVKEVRKQKIKLSDRNSVLTVSQDVTWNTFEHRGLVTADDRVSFANARTSGEAEFEFPTPMTMADVLDSQILSAVQKDVLERIEEARVNSDSYIEFSNRLATINNEIPTTVPPRQRALLFSITSIMYYSLEAMNELVGEGLLPGNLEQGSVTLAQLQLGFPSAMAGGESGGSSWWNEWGGLAAGVTYGAVMGGVLGGIVGFVVLGPPGAYVGGTVGLQGMAGLGAVVGMGTAGLFVIIVLED